MKLFICGYLEENQMKQGARCTTLQKATACPTYLKVHIALSQPQIPSLPERVWILIIYTGACWLEALNGTLAIEETGTQEGGAGGYGTVRYKSGTNSQRQRPEPLCCVLIVSQQWGWLPLKRLACSFPQITSIIYKILRYQLRNQVFFLSQGSGQLPQR